MEGKELIGEKFKDLSTVTVKVTIPMRIWDDWNKDCEANFNGTRYLKMKFDHDFRKQFSPLTELVISNLDDLSERLSILEEMAVQNAETKKVSIRKTMDGKDIK